MRVYLLQVKILCGNIWPMSSTNPPGVVGSQLAAVARSAVVDGTDESMRGDAVKASLSPKNFLDFKASLQTHHRGVRSVLTDRKMKAYVEHARVAAIEATYKEAKKCLVNASKEAGTDRAEQATESARTALHAYHEALAVLRRPDLDEKMADRRPTLKEFRATQSKFTALFDGIQKARDNIARIFQSFSAGKVVMAPDDAFALSGSAASSRLLDVPQPSPGVAPEVPRAASGAAAAASSSASASALPHMPSSLSGSMAKGHTDKPLSPETLLHRHMHLRGIQGESYAAASARFLEEDLQVFRRVETALSTHGIPVAYVIKGKSQPLSSPAQKQLKIHGKQFRFSQVYDPQSDTMLLMSDAWAAGNFGKVYLVYNPTTDNVTVWKKLLVEEAQKKDPSPEKLDVPKEERTRLKKMQRARSGDPRPVYGERIPSSLALIALEVHIQGQLAEHPDDAPQVFYYDGKVYVQTNVLGVGTLAGLVTGGDIFAPPVRAIDAQSAVTAINMMFRSLITQIASFHQKTNAVYHDCKPENVLVTQQGDVVLSDFGLVLLLDGDGKCRKNPGTPGFIAPEVLYAPDHNQSADLYSAGLTYIDLLITTLKAVPGALPPDLEQEYIVQRRQRGDVLRIDPASGAKSWGRAKEWYDRFAVWHDAVVVQQRDGTWSFDFDQAPDSRFTRFFRPLHQRYPEMIAYVVGGLLSPHPTKRLSSGNAMLWAVVHIPPDAVAWGKWITYVQHQDAALEQSAIVSALKFQDRS